MNKYIQEIRKRSQTLLIVEGSHEKNNLFWLIFKCFPELNIDMENVWIYGTNIYQLYEDIEKEYGENWNEEDIDLPYVVSRKKTPSNLRYKNDFTNIILVFDYERHDTFFSERKIVMMQNHFSDMTDMGKLYINYPMIESYQHFKAIPDVNYKDRKISVLLQPGKRYKELVRKESAIQNYVYFPHKLDDLLNKKIGIIDQETRQKCCEEVLDFSDKQHMEERLDQVLQNIPADAHKTTLKYQLKHWIDRANYANKGKTYWQYMRELLVKIIYYNACKANNIQNGVYFVKTEQYRDCFASLDPGIILDKQNKLSSADAGYIWVLNTSVFIVAEYNFSLVEKFGAAPATTTVKGSLQQVITISPKS